MRILTAICAALFAAASVPASAPAADLQHLRVSMAAQVAIYAPYLIAIEKGYYAQEGLALDITVASGGVATPALLSGSLDISTSNPSVISPALRGAPLRILYTEANRSQYQLWASTPDVKSIKDLKGKQVGVMARGDSLEISMKIALEHNNLPLDYVNFTPLGQNSTLTATLMTGSLPAVVLTDADAMEAKDNGALGKAHLLYDMHKDLPMPYSGIAVTQSFLDTHRPQLLGFLRATMKGVRYMRKFKAQTLAIVNKYDHEANSAVADFDYNSAVATLTQAGWVPDDLLRADLVVRASLIDMPPDKIPPPEKIYDYSLVKQANSELDATHWVPTP